MPAPQADRPQYDDGTPVPDSVDSSTQEYSRGEDQQTGAKGVEGAERVPTIASRNPATDLATAGGTVVTVTGDDFGGSTGATIGGTAVTGFVVDSETQCHFTTPAKAAGTYPLVIANPAGASAGFNVTYA
jgi:hypothetical protein